MDNLRHGRIINRQPITPGFCIASIYWRSKGIGLQHSIRHLLVTKVPKFHPQSAMLTAVRATPGLQLLTRYSSNTVA